MPEVLGPSKNIWNFDPRSVPGCVLWLDGGDNSTMNSTTTVTTWNDKSGQGNTMSGTATWNGTTMTFNGSTQAFSNLTFTFPYTSFSLFGVYSNTTAPTASAYMNAAYATGGYPMIGTYDVNKFVTARGVVGNTGALVGQVGWAAQMSGTSTSSDLSTGVATDSSGNVYVIGYYGATFTLYNTGGRTGPTLPFTGGSDVFLTKYSPTGTVLWAAQIAGTTTSTDNGNAVATDPSGNVFVTGNYGAALTLYNRNGTTGATLPFAGSIGGFIAKYSSSGTVLWAARFTGTSTCQAVGSGVATDSSGNVFVTGSYSQTLLTLYNSGETQTKTLALPTSGATFIAKYSSDGTSVMWAARIAGPSGSSGAGRSVATDSSGNLFVTGYYNGTSFTVYNSGETQTKTLPSSGVNLNGFLAKYSSDGTSVMWAAYIGGSTGNCIAYGVTTDSSGNVFITGYFSLTVILYNSGATSSKSLGSVGNNDCLLAKYSSDGSSVIWVAQIAGATTSYDGGQSVATDSSGNLFVTGYYGAALTLYNSGGTQTKTLPFAGGSSDCFLAKYSSDGTSVMWAAQIASTGGNDYGYGVATDSGGNVFVTGYYNAALTLYNTSGTTGATLANTGGNDVFLAKYSSTGYIVGGTPASSNVVVDNTYTGTTLSPYINGSNQTALTATVATATGFYVGGPTNYFNGSVSEILIYNNTLTANQRQSVEGYLASKWGVKSRLPTTHPFYVTRAFNRAFSPLDIPNCMLWLDGADATTMTPAPTSGSTVTAWKDKASSYSFTNTAVANEGGLASVVGPTFVSTGGLLFSNSSATVASGECALGISSSASGVGTNASPLFKIPTQGATLFVASSALSNNLYRAMAWVGSAQVGASPNNSNVWFSLEMGVSSGGIIGMDYNGTAWSQLYQPTTGNYSTALGARIDCLVSAPGASATGIFTNGSLISYGYATSYTSAFSNFPVNQVFIGGYTSSVWGNRNYCGTIYELIFFNSGLTTTQRQRVEGYLAQKWNMVSGLPATHPYKTIPPSISLPPQYSEVTRGNWVRDWQPYLKAMAAANSGATMTMTNLSPTILTTGNWRPVGASARGVLARNGLIYYAPSDSATTSILVLDPSTDTYSTITGGASFTGGFGAGVLADNDCIYWAPGTQTYVLIYNTITNTVSTIASGNAVTFVSGAGWLGGTLAPNGKIYWSPAVYPYPGVPNTILVVVPSTNKTYSIPSSTAAYYGVTDFTLGPNGCLYGFGQGQQHMKLDPVTEQITYFANPTNAYGMYSSLGLDGCIYGCPYVFPNNLLKMDPLAGDVVSYPAASGMSGIPVANGGYSIMGPDGKTYITGGYTSNSYIIILDTSTGSAPLFSNTSYTIGYNGAPTLAPNGNIYFGPCYYGTYINTCIKFTFSGLVMLPSINYCCSAYGNKT